MRQLCFDQRKDDENGRGSGQKVDVDPSTALRTGLVATAPKLPG